MSNKLRAVNGKTDESKKRTIPTDKSNSDIDNSASLYVHVDDE